MHRRPALSLREDQHALRESSTKGLFPDVIWHNDMVPTNRLTKGRKKGASVYEHFKEILTSSQSLTHLAIDDQWST